MMPKISSYFLLSILWISAISCVSMSLEDGPGGNDCQTIPLTKSEEQYAAANKVFAAELLQMYYDKKGKAYDFVFSPVSLQMFLGMLNAAASEEQSAQISGMLGYEGAGADGINSFCKKMLATSPTLDSKVVVDVVNQWWLNSATGFKLFPDFAGLLKDAYNVEGETRDFSREPMFEITRFWINAHSRGLIDFGCPPPYPRQCIIVNVSYLKAEWKEQFDLQESSEGDFYLEDGSKTKVTYMNKDFRQSELYSNDILQSLFLPLGDGAYRMEFYLPVIGKSVCDVLSELRSGDYPKQGETGFTVVSIPSFDLVSDNFALAEDLMNYFHVSVCDGTRSPAKYPLCGEDNTGIGMELNDICHIARIIVNEKGAEAAAVTGNFKAIAGPGLRRFQAKRPFVFLIREVGTGIVFFCGVYGGCQN